MQWPCGVAKCLRFGDTRITLPDSSATRRTRCAQGNTALEHVGCKLLFRSDALLYQKHQEAKAEGLILFLMASSRVFLKEIEVQTREIALA